MGSTGQQADRRQPTRRKWVHPDREVGQGNVAELRRHARRGAAELNERSHIEWRLVRTFLACSGATHYWYGVPWWPQYVQAFISEIANPESPLQGFYHDKTAGLGNPPEDLTEIAERLTNAPETLNDETLSWCIHDAHLGYVDHNNVLQQWHTDGKPRWTPPPLPL